MNNQLELNKYKGHTPGPWEYYYDPYCDDWILKTSRYIHSGKGVRLKKDLVDAQLIADAPLLLEEVKRLREQQQKILRIAETNMALEWGDTNHSFEWGYIIDMIKSWTTIVPCMHIDTANTLDGEVCLDCGIETGGEEE